MITDIATRVQEIRLQLGLSTTATSATMADSASGTTFASSLSNALGTASATGSAVVADAKKYLGVPYVFGGNDPKTGLDCSSLVQRVYQDLGIKLPRIAADQAKVGTSVASLDQARPGDLVCFGSPVNHIGIYIGDGKMIVAPHTGDVVKIQDVYKTPSTIRRIIPNSSSNPMNLASWGNPTVRPSSLRPTSSSDSVPYASLFTQAAERYGVSATLLAAVAKVESNYDPTAVSSAGAKGLMQIMPGTARDLGVDPLDPAQAVDGAARLLASNLQQFDGSLELALAAYNAGAGAVKKYGGIPPYAETQAYVPKVKAALSALEASGL